jgi:peptidoglycan-associated lipoprotein
MATTMAADRPGWTPIAEPSADPVHDILFDFDSALLRPDALATLQENLAWFSRHPAVPVVIEGHCDERGSREYNLALGQRRADAAADYLIKGGLSPQRVRTISYGKELPFALGHDEAAWALNRRAHFRTPGTAAASSPDE